jgi:ABC-type uncharacterized transport system ATPase subunit
METASTTAEELAGLMVGGPSIRPDESGLLGIGRDEDMPTAPIPRQRTELFETERVEEEPTSPISRQRTELSQTEQIEEEPTSPSIPPSAGVSRGEEAHATCVLQVADLSVEGRPGIRAVDSVSFEVRAGEILGVAGVDGNGQRELAEALVGLRRASGSAALDGKELLRMTVRRRLDAGIAYVPEDRRFAVVPDDSLRDNAILGFHHRKPFSAHGILDAESAREHASTLVADLDIRATGTETPVRFLSGGNQQKLVLGKALYRSPKLLIACQPTHGLDVNASAEIHRRLLAARSRGAGVLLISYDLDEILSLSDRIMVMYRGRPAGILPASEATRDSIGALMLGASPSPTGRGLSRSGDVPGVSGGPAG